MRTVRKSQSKKGKLGVTLGRFGYKSSLSKQKRRDSLRKAVKCYGKNAVNKKLRTVSTLLKNRSPSKSRRISQDASWIQKIRQARR
jgi:ATP-dependent DNA ligase